jgi:hypothetical protein
MIQCEKHNWIQPDSTAIPPCPYCKIAELEAAQRWIPVSEQMPEYNETVWGFFVSAQGTTRRAEVTHVDSSDSDWESEGYKLGNNWDITHWMPLPAPPEALQEVGE